MNQNKLLRDVASLPPSVQKEVVDFIEFLKLRHGQETFEKKSDNLIEKEPFIGIWQNRSDMADSTDWVRNLRQKEWRVKNIA